MLTPESQEEVIMAEDGVNKIKPFLKSHGLWFSYNTQIFKGRVGLMIQYVNLVVLFSLSLGVGYGIYVNGLKSSLNGKLIFFPVSVITVGHNIICCLYPSTINNTIKALKKCISTHEEYWEVNVQEKNINIVWNLISIYTKLTSTISIIYIAVPVILDILVNSFHLFNMKIPNFAKPYNTMGETGFVFFIFTLFNFVWAILILRSHLGFWGLYTIIVVSAYSEMVIFRKHLTSLVLKQYPMKIEFITSRHTNILRFNNEVKELFGLPCAFQSSLLSFSLCVCLFIVITTDDPSNLAMHVYGTFFYITNGMFYCGLGELFQYEEDKIFTTICEMPWHTLSPHDRKNFNMMLRQAKKSQRIEYRGRTPMNLGTYAKFINSSYTYFMLIRSMTK